MAAFLDLPSELDAVFPSRIPEEIDTPFLRRVATAYLGRPVKGLFRQTAGAALRFFCDDEFDRRWVIVQLETRWVVGCEFTPAHLPHGSSIVAHQLRAEDAYGAKSLVHQIIDACVPSAVVIPCVSRRLYLLSSDIGELEKAPPQDLIYEYVFLVNGRHFVLESRKAGNDTCYRFIVDGMPAGDAVWSSTTHEVSIGIDELRHALTTGSRK
jgi:hypothetical protein